MIPIHSNPSAPHPFDTLGTPAKPASGAQPSSSDSPEEQKLKKAAGDFESILLASMWKSMKQSFGEDDDTSADADPAHGTLEDWGIEIMSGAVGKAGGLGIGNLILKDLEPQLERTSSAPAAQENTGSGPVANANAT